MDILELSKRMEQEGRDYYLKLAHEAKNSGLSGAFSLLAQAEHEHYALVASWKDTVPAIPDDTDIPGQVRTLFAGIAEDLKKREILCDAEEAYRNALILEQKSIAHYTEAREHEGTQEQKELFDFLINEEREHMQLIENLIELVHRPKDWLEDAEVNHRDEY